MVGTGYVGLVVGACLAETGNDVVCADRDEQKVDKLSKGLIPIFERGLQELVAKNLRNGRLGFTSDVGSAVESAEVVFLAVGTPPDEDGSADLQYVVAVAEIIGKHMNFPKVVVTKSTVPVGTAAVVRETIERYTEKEFDVCSNPEFLKEGAAVGDFMKPDRVIVGVDSDRAREVLSDLYAPFIRSGNPLIVMDVVSAELTKYAANAMLATRISFMNQMAEICEQVGADITNIRRGIGTDTRIGRSFLYPGPGYGGSCFPKDVRALINMARDYEVTLDLLEATEAVNHRQKRKLFQMVSSELGARLAGATIAVWGLAFKAETDDMRESPSIPLMHSLLGAKASVVAYDPEACQQAEREFADQISYADTMYEALRGADALVIVTEWSEFRNPDFERLKSNLKNPLIVDGRNLYLPEKMRKLGIRYLSIGRSPAA